MTHHRTQVDESGRTALHWASDCGHEGVVALLLAAGAERDARDGDGMTALAYAVTCEVVHCNVMYCNVM